MAAPGAFEAHGGRLCTARALHPDAPLPWIDLSTGINPHSYPAARASEAARARLPTPEETRSLEAAAGRAFGVDDAERVAATAGSEAGLRLMPHVLLKHGLGSGERCPDASVLGLEQSIVAGPTYSSHAAAYRAAGLRAADRLADDVPARTAVTIVNPNNPDGGVSEPERLLRLHDDIVARHGYLVVDEAFADVAPACSVAPLAGSARYPNLIVLRSFGKFYGLAGIRLGFVIAAPSILARLRELLGDWPVSADAIAAGTAAYADDSWADRMRETLCQSALRLDAVLIGSGLTVIGGTSLFRLTRSEDARARFERLLRAGILARPFEHDATLLRFGLPPHDPSAWQRLAAALRTP
jgi:cobalamin biosynthesis protein CobC